MNLALNYSKNILLSHVLCRRFHPKAQLNLSLNQGNSQRDQRCRFQVIKTAVFCWVVTQQFPRNSEKARCQTISPIQKRLGKKIQDDPVEWQEAVEIFKIKSPIGVKTIQLHSRANVKTGQVASLEGWEIRKSWFGN